MNWVAVYTLDADLRGTMVAAFAYGDHAKAWGDANYPGRFTLRMCAEPDPQPRPVESKEKQPA